MVALRGLRPPGVGRRLDFETPGTRAQTGPPRVTTDGRRKIDIPPAIDRGLHLLALAETPFAFDDGVGCVDAVNDDGHAGAAGNYDIEAAAGQSLPRRSDQNCQC